MAYKKPQGLKYLFYMALILLLVFFWSKISKFIGKIFAPFQNAMDWIGGTVSNMWGDITGTRKLIVNEDIKKEMDYSSYNSDTKYRTYLEQYKKAPYLLVLVGIEPIIKSGNIENLAKALNSSVKPMINSKIELSYLSELYKKQYGGNFESQIKKMFSGKSVAPYDVISFIYWYQNLPKLFTLK